MQQIYTIHNPNGIHARPARQIVTSASAYPCAIYLEKEGKRVNAKSLVAVLTMGGKYGDAITVIAEGEQQEDAVEAIGTVLSTVWDEGQ